MSEDPFRPLNDEELQGALEEVEWGIAEDSPGHAMSEVRALVDEYRSLREKCGEQGSGDGTA